VADTACQADSCSGHGSCDDGSGALVCTCDAGYAGDACDACAAGYHDDGSGACVADTTCQADSCSGNGSCDDSSGAVVCTCDTGYAGDACESCAPGYVDDGTGTCVENDSPHPAGWADPAQHGAAAKNADLDCRTCHGAGLTGQGDAPSCDSCHANGWRTNCTFCHGGQDNQTGAPPVDLSGRSLTSEQTVGAHTTHVTGANHMTYDCDQCHIKPTDVLSPGHLFDATPGVAELNFSGGLSAAGSYDGPGCSSLYCHGNGRGDNGSVAAYTGTIDTCTACHPAPPNSGHHQVGSHVNAGCRACHNAVAGANNTIIGPELHVNGNKDVELRSGGTYNANTGSCNPSCHGTRTW